jgi:hypothetical protein
MQRMGQGGRKMGTTATGIYLVEPKYFDNHKNKVTTSGKRKRGKASSGQGNQKQKKSKPNQTTASDGKDSSDDESGSDGEDKRQENRDVHSGNAADDVMETDHEGGSLPKTSQLSALNPTPGPVACPVIPPLAGLNDAEYEFAVMDVYINAKSQRICHRKVCNEYFGNDKGMILNITH